MGIKKTKIGKIKIKHILLCIIISAAFISAAYFLRSNSTAEPGAIYYNEQILSNQNYLDYIKQIGYDLNREPVKFDLNADNIFGLLDILNTASYYDLKAVVTHYYGDFLKETNVNLQMGPGGPGKRYRAEKYDSNGDLLQIYERNDNEISIADHVVKESIIIIKSEISSIDSFERQLAILTLNDIKNDRSKIDVSDMTAELLYNNGENFINIEYNFIDEDVRENYVISLESGIVWKNERYESGKLVYSMIIKDLNVHYVD